MKMHYSFIFLVNVIFISCLGQNPKKYESISPNIFAEKINTTQNPQIFDVRTPKEFDGEHLENAVNINWNSNDFEAKIMEYDKSKPVFVYCLSGGRSKQAASKLEAMGFKTIYELDGGIIKWNAAGLSKPSDKIIGMSLAEYKLLLNSDKKILVNFYADWCAPCKKMAPFIFKMQQELKDQVLIIRLDADANKTLLKELKIIELPALFVYDNKDLKWQHAGFISESDLKKQL